MKILNYILTIVLTGTIAYFLFNQEGCYRSPNPNKILRDSIPVPFFVPSIEFRDTGTTKRILIPAKADSNAIWALLAVMDSLRQELKNAQVKSLFSMDTTTKDNDRIHVDCDEISKSIALKIEFGKREVYIPREREVVVQMEKPKWSIGVGGGAVFVLPDAQIKYGVTANLQYNIFTF